MVNRNFVIIGHRARTAADWKLDDLCGGAGRLDVLVRCVTAALWKSHGLREKTNVWLILNPWLVVFGWLEKVFGTLNK